MHKSMGFRSSFKSAGNFINKFYFKSRYNYNTIPSIPFLDKELGIFSNIRKSGSMYQFLKDSHEKCGDVITFDMLNKQYISICHPQLFKKFTKVFDRIQDITRNNVMSAIIGEDSIFFSEGDDGKARRKRYLDIIMSSDSIQKSYLPDQVKRADPPVSNALL